MKLGTCIPGQVIFLSPGVPRVVRFGPIVDGPHDGLVQSNVCQEYPSLAFHEASPVPLQVPIHQETDADQKQEGVELPAEPSAS